MIRRPPRSTRVRSSAASDVYKRQVTCPRVLGFRLFGLVPKTRSAYTFGDQLGLVPGTKSKIEDGSAMGTLVTLGVAVFDFPKCQPYGLQLVPRISSVSGSRHSGPVWGYFNVKTLKICHGDRHLKIAPSDSPSEAGIETYLLGTLGFGYTPLLHMVSSLT